MNVLKFSAIIEIIGVNPYVTVSAEQAKSLKSEWRRPMPVLVQVNGLPKDPWHINMMPKGDGSFYLYLHGDVRNISDTKVGDTVNVTVQFDKQYKNGPQHSMPTWFKISLDANPTAQKNWELLPPSRQKEILRYFAALKSTEAQQRNAEKVIKALSGEEVRFMARSWKDGK